MRRVIEPELLDELPPADPRAVRSRADLRRLNLLMGHTRILSRALHQRFAGRQLPAQPVRLVELGAGDGTMLLSLARRWSTPGFRASVTLLDRHDLLSAETRRAFAVLRWSVGSLATEVSAWLAQPAPVADVMLANLFLHHFPDNLLRPLLRLAAARATLFIACEPRRSPLVLLASRLVWLLGCNGVTRHDAAISVRAGFAGHELSALWPADGQWESCERSAGRFSHLFMAKRNA